MSYQQIGIYRGVYGLVKYIRTDNDCSHYDTLLSEKGYYYDLYTRQYEEEATEKIIG